jgi:hypothetical protein
LIAQAEGLAVDKESVLAGVVLNGEIVAPGEELLLHEIDHLERLLTAEPAHHDLFLLS